MRGEREGEEKEKRGSREGTELLIIECNSQSKFKRREGERHRVKRGRVG